MEVGFVIPVAMGLAEWGLRPRRRRTGLASREGAEVIAMPTYTILPTRRRQPRPDARVTGPTAHAGSGIIGGIRTAAAQELARCKTETATCMWGGFVGVAPHVLHHAGPLAGTALMAGAGGQLAFGVVGFIATIPVLWRLHRRKGGWRAPAWALGAFAVVFTLSSLVIGPAVAGITEPDPPAVTQPTEPDEHDHGR